MSGAAPAYARSATRSLEQSQSYANRNKLLWKALQVSVSGKWSDTGLMLFSSIKPTDIYSLASLAVNEYLFPGFDRSPANGTVLQTHSADTAAADMSARAEQHFQLALAAHCT